MRDLQSVLGIVTEILNKDERAGLARAEESYHALGSPLEENKLRESLWVIMQRIRNLHDPHVRYPKVFLRIAHEMKERAWSSPQSQPTPIPQTLHFGEAPRPSERGRERALAIVRERERKRA